MAEPLAGLGHNMFGNVTQRDVLAFIDRYLECDEEVRSAVAERKDLRAAIKAAGIPLGAFDRMRRDSDKSGEVREIEDAWYRQMMAWRMKPVGFQATMDLDTSDPDVQAFNIHELHRIDLEGLEAGRNNRRRDSNSYTPGTEGYQRWDNAWVRGNAEIASTLGDSAPPNGAAQPVKRRGRPRGSRNRPREAEVAAEQSQEPPPAGGAPEQGSDQQVH